MFDWCKTGVKMTSRFHRNTYFDFFSYQISSLYLSRMEDYQCSIRIRDNEIKEIFLNWDLSQRTNRNVLIKIVSIIIIRAGATIFHFFVRFSRQHQVKLKAHVGPRSVRNYYRITANFLRYAYIFMSEKKKRRNLNKKKCLSRAPLWTLFV